MRGQDEHERLERLALKKKALQEQDEYETISTISTDGDGDGGVERPYGGGGGSA